MRRRRTAHSGPRVGLWGAGAMGGAYAAAAGALGWQVSIVASRSPARAGDLAGRLGATATTFDRFPTAQIDLAIVATPPSNHVAAVEFLAGAGVPTLVCTPLAATLDAADDIVSIDAAGSGLVTFGANVALSPLVGGLLRYVPTMGRLTSLVGRSQRRMPSWGGFSDGSWGGGALVHLGSQLLTPMLLTARLAGAGTPTSVSASFRTDGPIETRAEVSIRFASGLLANASIGWDHNDDQATWDLQASSATTVVRADMNPRPTLECNGDPMPLPSPSVSLQAEALTDVGLTGQLELLWSDARSGARPALSAALGRSVLEIVVAASHSAGRGGDEVRLPFDGDRSLTPFETYRLAREG